MRGHSRAGFSARQAIRDRGPAGCSIAPLPRSQSAARDESGVWRPKKLAAPPKTTHAASYHAYPLNHDDRVDSRLVDVTFRLALIAKVAGRPVQYT